MTTPSDDVRAVLVMADRGALPFTLLHGEPLVLHALHALLAAWPARVMVVVDDGCREQTAHLMRGLARGAVTLVDPPEWWESRGGGTDVLHDPLCPLVPEAFLRDLGTADGVARAAYRPVTDTVKTALDGRISGTLDRDRLGVVVAPVVLPPSIAVGEPHPPLAFAPLVRWLRARGAVELVRAPSAARRVDDEQGVMLLECVEESARRVR
jgi:hypothetical protein